MATIQIQFLTLGSPPPLGYKVGYRTQGSTGAYTMLSYNVVTSPAIISGLASGKYEGYLEVDCGAGTPTGARTYWTTSTPTGTGGSTTVTTPTYVVTPTIVSVSEGGTVTFNVLTNNVDTLTQLYYKIISSKVTADDFTDNAMSGAFTIVTGYGTTGGTGSFSKTLKQDTLLEGVETFTVAIKTGSVEGNTVATSVTISIVDTSTPANASDPTYSITPNVSSVEEGSAVTFNIATTNVANGTQLFYTINPSTYLTGADFGDGSLNGSVIIQNNAASFTKTIALDGFFEQGDSFTVSLRTSSITGPVKATSGPVSIINYSPAQFEPTYTIVPSTTSVNEGSNITFTVNTTDVTNGTILYYTIESASNPVSVNDFTGNTLSGQFEINNNTGSVTRTIVADTSTEGVENFYFKLRTGSISGTVVKTSALITINDTSLAPSVVTYYNVVTCDTGSAGVLQYNGANNLTVGDIVRSSNGVCYTIDGVSTSTTASVGLYQSNYATCNDCTGYTPPAATYNTLVINPTTVSEGGAITGTLTTSNVIDGTVLHFTLWTGSSVDNELDFTQQFSGSFTINNNTGTFTRTLVADLLTEGTETFKIDIRTGGPTGPIVKTSDLITVLDTSRTPAISTYWYVNRCDGLGSGVIRDYETVNGASIGMIVMSTNGTAYIITGQQTNSTEFSSGDVDYEISTCPGA